MSALDADAIVVLGCAIRPGGEPSAALTRRCRLAARLYRRGAASTVIASGGRSWGCHIEAVVMKRVLLSEGVAAADVIMELCSLNTLENGHYTAHLLRARGAQRALLATCAWHMPRALRNFRRFGVDALAPPRGWLDTPAPSAKLRLREAMWTGVDALLGERAARGGMETDEWEVRS
jgi:uncharacterized SAM-binding protein YcdF (DUF218 family)